MTGWWATRRWRLAAACSVTIGSLSTIALSGAPTVYPTGTTIYHPAKTWNGFTVFITPESEGVIVIDMNGRVVKQWTGLWIPQLEKPGERAVIPPSVRDFHIAPQ